MKLRISKEQAGVLLVVLIAGGIIGITLGSFLGYTATQTRSIMRSQAWNAAIPVAEAGVEEALAHINDSTIGTNFAINGWTVVDGQFQRAGTVNGGRYVARISRDTFPTITCVGYTSDGRRTNEYRRTVQATTTRYATGMKGIVSKGDLTMIGGASMNSFDSEDERYSTRGRYDPAKQKDGGYAASVLGNVYAETIYGSVGTGPNGMVSGGTVGDFGWVSSNTGIQPGKYANDVNLAFPLVQAPFSGGASSIGGSQTVTLTNFAYWSTMITTTNIPSPPPASPITTNLTGSITVAYPNYPTGVLPGLITTNVVYGYAEKKNLPPPPAGSYVGTITTSGPNRYYDKIVSYTYPTLTYTYSMTVTNNSATTQSYDHVLTGDRYETTDLRMSGSERLLVLGTNVSLYINRDFAMTGQSEIIIAPGASLKVYVGGAMDLNGNGLFNYTMDASKMELFGLPSNRHIDISGNAAFTGVVYAPQADITMNGGGASVYDVVGAIIGNSVVMNGHFQFHYDERLGRAKIQSKYNVASWHEL